MDTRNIKQKNHAGSKLIQGTVGDFNSHSSQQVEHSFLQIHINKHIYFCFVNVWLSLHRSRETQHFVVIFLLLGNYKQNYGQYVFFFQEIIWVGLTQSIYKAIHRRCFVVQFVARTKFPEDGLWQVRCAACKTHDPAVHLQVTLHRLTRLYKNNIYINTQNTYNRG